MCLPELTAAKFNYDIHMKAYKVDYQQNQHLLDALIAHAKDLGYEALEEDEKVCDSCTVLSVDEEGMGTTDFNFEEFGNKLISAKKFFNIKPEESIKKLTVKEISEKLGYKVEVVEG